ncbi:hypothetical protein J6590_060099 [Homalodisca vitripennis]|nr:hypothetical protein J6590_060099 [Homalodisca vitripennis]
MVHVSLDDLQSVARIIFRTDNAARSQYPLPSCFPRCLAEAPIRLYHALDSRPKLFRDEAKMSAKPTVSDRLLLCQIALAFANNAGLSMLCDALISQGDLQAERSGGQPLNYNSHCSRDCEGRGSKLSWELAAAVRNCCCDWENH